jgi:hypothetical protein
MPAKAGVQGGLRWTDDKEKMGIICSARTTSQAPFPLPVDGGVIDDLGTIPGGLAGFFGHSQLVDERLVHIAGEIVREHARVAAQGSTDQVFLRFGVEIRDGKPARRFDHRSEPFRQNERGNRAPAGHRK